MNTTINRAADNIRILAASMVEKAKSGHPGGAMGVLITSMSSIRNFSTSIPMISVGKTATVFS